ncbi:TetR/AcrR family transcriptional regulator [Actinacidiphila alni]|uniref:TetR/AcrR family transcriptional regulator n=1 Tax=Actinacidiphila alni TaxID=380248 RepID=UPI003405B89D
MTAQTGTGRTNQKLRTRTAILAATRDLIGTGAEVTMATVARGALVSEATAYRYFPDLSSLISEALSGSWPPPAEALAPVADSSDTVERVAFACEYLLRGVLARQGAVRAMIAATVTRPETVRARPGIRFGLIDHALLPLKDTLGATEPAAFAQLERDLAVTVSAEALFTLTDLCGLDAETAIGSAVRTATTLTEAAVRRVA